MPRPLRIFGDDLHYHVTVKCNNSRFYLTEADFNIIRNMLIECKSELHFRLYDYAMMHSHIHFLISTHAGIHLDKIMKLMCLNFSKNYNERHNRTGHFWGNRYWCRVVDDDRYALACMRYFAWNAPKAGIVSHPSKWKWSGYQFYANCQANQLLTRHPSFSLFGKEENDAGVHYKQFVNIPFSADDEWFFQEKRKYGSKLFSMRLLEHVNGLLYRSSI